MRELFVAWHDRFVEIVAEPSTPELARRLAALDRGEQVDPAQARLRLQQRSAQRRKKSA